MKVTIAQLNYTVGDLVKNADKIINTIETCDRKCRTIIVFSELCISGYPPLDLLDNTTFIDDQLKQLDRIVAATKCCPHYIILGYIEKNYGPGKSLYNSLAVICDGKQIYNYRKRLLPTYDIFDEARYFEPGKQMGLVNIDGLRVGLLICEDFWYNNKLYTLDTAEELYTAHANFIISINASPSIVGKRRKRFEMISDISQKYAMPICYANQVGGNDDVVFDGASFVTDNQGQLLIEGFSFEECIISTWPCTTGSGYGENKPVYGCDSHFFYEQAVLGIKDYVTKNGFKGVVIGESGGIDSAVVTALAVKALGAEMVHAVTMPSKYSSSGSVNDSLELCRNLGVFIDTCPIKEQYEAFMKVYSSVFGKRKMGVTEENLQARIRGQILMALSNQFGWLVLSTGNKSELSVGYCTIYGDMCGGLDPISDLYKMEVYDVAKYINGLEGRILIPLSIINKAPSAELRPNQKDSDSLPDYPLLDKILKYYIEGDALDEIEVMVLKNAVDRHPDQAKRVLGLINKAEFKRRQAALGLKMHAKAFGYGRRIPIVNKYCETVKSNS